MIPTTAPAPLSVGPAAVASVETALSGNKDLKPLLGPKDTNVPRKDGLSYVPFPKLAVDLANWIQKRLPEGKVILKLPASEIEDFARQYLDEKAEADRQAAIAEELAAENQDASPAATAPAQTPAAASAPAPEVAPAAAPASAPVPTAPVAPVAAAPTAEVAPAPKKARRAKAETPAPAAAVAPVAPAASAPAPAASPAVAAEPAETAVVKEAPVSVALAIYSLLHSADALAERDTQPGFEERRKRLAAAMHEYRQVIPC